MSADVLATEPREFNSRRRRLMESLSNGAIVLAAGHDAARNSDVDHEYRQPSTFWYLTGFDEPDAVVVLRPGSHTPYTLFVRPYDPTFEIWVGYRAGVRGAVGPLGANAAYSVDQLDSQLPSCSRTTIRSITRWAAMTAWTGSFQVSSSVGAEWRRGARNPFAASRILPQPST